MITVLHKIFTRRFYIQNTGFFLVIFYLLFGVVDGSSLISYHRSLMLGFLSNPLFLTAVLGIWLLYALKCTAFVLKSFQLQGYDFLYPTIGSISKPERRQIWIMLQLSIYLPVLIYAGIAMVVGFAHQYYTTSAIIFLFNIIMCVWPLLLYERKLERPDVLFFTSRLQGWINRRFVKPPVLYFLYELFANFPQRIFIIKLFSAATLWLTFLLLVQTGSFDLRGLQLGMMACVLLHIQLMHHHRAFDDVYLGFMRQLPIPLTIHYLRLAGIYLLLFLPEMLIVAVNVWGKTDWLGTLTVYATTLSLLLIFRSLLYFPKLNPEIHFRYVLLIAFVVLFMVLGGLAWIAVVLMQIAAIIIFFRQYRRYELYIEA